MAFDYDLTDLRLIVHVVDTSSLTRGAERCHLSAPAASARLKKVQESIGMQLFYRTTQGLVPTAAGHGFVRHARAVLRQLEVLDGELREKPGEPGGCIRLYVNTLSMGDAIPSVVERFLLAHPRVRIELHERPSAEIARALKGGQADVGILTSETPDPGLLYRDYSVERLALVTARAHPLAQCAPVVFRDSLAHDQVGLGEHTALHSFLRRKAAGESQELQTRMQASNFEALCGLVASGVGIAIVPVSAAERHAERLGLAVVPLADAWAERTLRVAVRDGQALTPAATAFIEALVRERATGDA